MQNRGTESYGANSDIEHERQSASGSRTPEIIKNCETKLVTEHLAISEFRYSNKQRILRKHAEKCQNLRKFILYP